MEPGHEDREYAGPTGDVVFTWPPQWSPVMKTGNTRHGSMSASTSTCLNGARS